MDQKEYDAKYRSLRILKSIQEYLKKDDPDETAVYPIRVPDQLVYQIMKIQGSEQTDDLIHTIFKRGLEGWADDLYRQVFGSPEGLAKFIKEMKTKET